MKDNKLLEVRNLRTYFETRQGLVKSVNGINFELNQGQVLGLVGESGAGKSITGFSLMRLINPPGKIAGGEIMFKGQDLMKLTAKEMEEIRGNQISMVFQDPMTSLNPVLKIGEQLMEVLKFHNGLNKKMAKKRAIELLKMVGIPSPQARINQYPHQLSGGMRQRVVIAIAMASNPELLIADEPTTALDVTIQAQIISLMKKLITEKNTAMIFISHDLALVSEIADQIAVMYAGNIIEYGSKAEIIANPQHPYTKGLINSLPLLDRKQTRLKQIKGIMPTPLNLPEGCKFKARCPEAGSECDNMPQLLATSNSHSTACHHAQTRAMKGVS